MTDEQARAWLRWALTPVVHSGKCAEWDPGDLVSRRAGEVTCPDCREGIRAARVDVLGDVVLAVAAVALAWWVLP